MSGPQRLAELQGTQLPPFTGQIVAWVRWSIDQLPSDNARLLTDVFYEELFVLAPQARPMFPEDMDPQKDRLLGALLAAAKGMDDPAKVEPHLRRWGVTHRRTHGVSDDLYVFVGQALIRTINRLLTNQDSLVHSSWVAVYAWMAAVMIDGADQAEVIDRNPRLLLAQRDEQPEPVAEEPAPDVRIATVHTLTPRMPTRPGRRRASGG